MLLNYRIITQEEFDRNGQDWWFCDAPNCESAIQVNVDDCVPDGWETSDPGNDPLAGAAQFCSEHVSRLTQTVE